MSKIIIKKSDKVVIGADGKTHIVPDDDAYSGKIGVWNWYYDLKNKYLHMSAFNVYWYKDKTQVELEDLEQAITDLVHEFQNDLFPL